MSLIGLSLLLLEVVVAFEQRGLCGKLDVLCGNKRPSPYLFNSRGERGENAAGSEPGAARCSHSTAGHSGSRDREKFAQALTAPHSSASRTTVADNKRASVYYLPKTFEDFREREDAA